MMREEMIDKIAERFRVLELRDKIAERFRVLELRTMADENFAKEKPWESLHPEVKDMYRRPVTKVMEALFAAGFGIVSTASIDAAMKRAP
jgi:hypothetical protein